MSLRIATYSLDKWNKRLPKRPGKRIKGSFFIANIKNKERPPFIYFPKAVV